MDIGIGKKLNVAFTGPECSGKSFLAKYFSDKYNGKYVEEYAREYLSKTNGLYKYEDLENIAIKQWNLIQEKSDKNKFIDTELLVIEIWSKVRFSRCCNFVLNNIKKQNIEHYFLCKPDLPWEYDVLRENPYDRMELFDLYYKKILNYSLPFTIIEGKYDERIAKVDEVLLSIK